LEMRCRIVTWDEIYRWCKNLVAKIEKSGYRPDTLIALARSGFVPGRIISDLLGITNLLGLKVEHWLDTTGQHRDEATIPYKVPFKLRGRKVLVVDDIVDTGKSMKVSVEYIKRFNPEELKVAVLQYITSSEFIPDYYAVKVRGWAWFVYPWNLTEDLCNLMERAIKTDPNICKNFREASRKFKEKYGLDVEPKTIKEVITTLEKRGRI